MLKKKNLHAVGIIAEYNPFHNGHAYHIRKAKELANAEYAVVVMSGDFVQRGSPAIYDKYTRTAMALSCGADLVLEIPSVFASSSAEDFASCAVALLNGLGAVDSLCFGSESGDMEKLSAIATILANEPAIYSEELRIQLKKGAAFPKARNAALVTSGAVREEDASILSSPNNILGIEYLKAIYRQSASLIPLTIERNGSDYHDPLLTPDRFCSATGLRKALKETDHLSSEETIFDYVPEPVKLKILESKPLYYDDFNLLLNTALLRLSMEGIPFQNFADVSDELAARITKQLPDYHTFEEKINQLKTRQYTYTRISRALLHILLGTTNQLTAAGRQAGYAPYARILGFKKTSVPLMGEIKKRGSIPLIAKTAGAETGFTGAAASMLRHDFYSSHIYQTVLQAKYDIKVKNEFTQSVVIL
ncbi:nucleotidyltransferase [Lacrimispora amygdalina]|uniref:tRNA(Met) cytidine acetate ligase n=1 Tax=Lacrimispora amygdalina TaxID=253257 RepID=A0A3E2N7J3_9FIRM|nr:nucleotidyltransferase [Clostridium indicum]RFZ76861.1 nucleotidyltransferase [Clostridium indicum]